MSRYISSVEMRPWRASLTGRMFTCPSSLNWNFWAIPEFLDDCVIFDINSEVKRLAVTIRRNHRLRLPDAIIAATALYLKAPLLSVDRDFEKINELSLFLYETGAP